MTSTVPAVFAVDHSADTLISIRGADRAKFLHGFCTNDIKSLQTGQSCEAFITNNHGKTIGHVIVDCQPDQLLLHTAPGQAEKLIKHLDRYIITEDVTLRDVGGEYSQWLVAGEAAEARLGESGILKVPYLGKSFLFTVPEANAFDEQLSTLHVSPFSDAASLAGMRIEANWPLFGSDITDENLPQEIGRDREAINFEKGCYLGQETVARLDALGHVNRILTRVRLPAELAVGTELTHDGKVVGKLTSVGYSPQRSAWIAFALIRVAHKKAGTKLQTSGGEAELI